MISKNAYKYIALGALLLLLIASIGTVAANVLTPEEQLGKSIFFDENLSINQNQSCASCHDPHVVDTTIAPTNKFLRLRRFGFLP